PTLALGGYHAVIGLVLFAVLVLIMLWVLPWFGVRYRDPVPGPTGRAASARTATAPAASAASARAVSATAPRRAVRWTRGRMIAAGTVVALTLIVALADHGLQPYAAFDDGSGPPTA